MSRTHLWAAVVFLIVATACSGPAPTLQPGNADIPATEPQVGPPSSLEKHRAQESDPSPTGTTTSSAAVPASSPIRHSPVALTPAGGAAQEATELPASTPEPAPSPTTVLPPIVGIDTGENTWYVEPGLLALLLRHEAGDSEVPDRLRLYVAWFNTQEGDGPPTDRNPDKFIASKGRTSEEQDHVWTVPTEAIVPLLQLPGVYAVAQWSEGQTKPRDPPSYPKLNEHLSPVMRAYELGIPAEQAAQYVTFSRGDQVMIRIESRNEQDKQSVIAWLESENIHIQEKQREPSRSVNIHWAHVLLPGRLVIPATERPDVSFIRTEAFDSELPSMQRHHWTREVLDYVNAMVDIFVPEGERVFSPD